MLIFWKERLVFLSTPKTGSTSIETALESLAHVAIRRPPELKHMPAHDFRTSYGPYLEARAGEKFTTIALMREPIDWLGSWYRYRKRDELGEKDRSTRGLDFAAAAEGYLTSPVARNMDVGSQAGFLCDPQGNVAVDRLFRYEKIEQFVEFLEDRLDYEIVLPRLNVSPAGQTDLPADVRARLTERFEQDYAIYNSLE
jgi:hypothetical protein